MNDPQNSDRLILKHAQELVSMVGLECGRLSMEVHAGRAQNVDIHQCFRLSSGRFVKPSSKLVTPAAEQFVRTCLEPSVVDQQGRYGRLTIRVKDGNVEIVEIGRKIKNSPI